MDYCCPERRKTRGDKRAKRRFALYKKGGKHRTENISYSGVKEEKSNN